MHGIELIIVLLFMVLVLAIIAFRMNIPYPMVLLVGGTVIAFTPGLPHVVLDPELVFVLFLPPILFSAAYFTSWRDFKANRRPIALLAVGGVLATMVIVAVVAHALIPEISWPVAFVIGAIVSPPDAVAATSIFQRLGVPHRTVTILEGESLVNDASALIAFRFAVGAVVAGTFSIWEASSQFVLVATGGVILGLAAGWLMGRVIRWIPEPSLVIATTLISPLGIYLLAESIHVSGVLATVAAGLTYSRMQSLSTTPEARSGGKAVWTTGILLINCLVFILMGLQIGEIVDALPSESLSTLLWQALAISLAVIVARFIWVYPATYLPRLLSRRLREADPLPRQAAIFVIAWSGLRGIVSLASALALPLTLDTGEPFPFREETVFITFVVIVVTLLGQGLPLPWLLTKLDFHDDGKRESEFISARRLAATAILSHLKELEPEPWVPLGHVIELRTRFSHSLEHLPESGRVEDYDTDHIESHNRLREEVIGAARKSVIDARNRGEIGDEARLRVEQELDFELLRTEF
jgi:CPA1 family monovalent cation:H+ antiporter